MRPNPSAYLDARGVAHVQMPEQQEGIPGPRIANMVRSLGLSRAAAERLREKMRRADETGDGIEDILREAQRALRAKSVAYYPGAADAPGAPDGIAFVDRGDPKAETLLYDHRDGRFTVNAWGPAVARQRERFQKNNPRAVSATGAPMPTQFVTNPRRPAAKKSAARRNPAFKSPHAGPSVKRMVDFLGISKSDAQALKDQMNEGATVGSILKAADRILDGNGVEAIPGVGGGLSYVNMGDTYDYTLIYDRKSRRFVAAAWGDIVEAQPRRFAD